VPNVHRGPPAPPCGRPWHFLGVTNSKCYFRAEPSTAVIPLTARQKCPEITNVHDKRVVGISESWLF
jgi:hypothetical protein